MADPGIWGFIRGAASLLSDLFTIGASGIAIYIFIMKRDAVSSVFSMLLNYSYQISLSELKEKIERLNEYSAKDTKQIETIINIFHEIIGQIRGNDKLQSHFSDTLARIEKYVSAPKYITEPEKRSLISEIRERLRHINVENFDSINGGKK